MCCILGFVLLLAVINGKEVTGCKRKECCSDWKDVKSIHKDDLIRCIVMV